MLQVDQHLEGVPDDSVGAVALGVDNEADAAGVVLVARVVEALGGRWRSVWHKHVMSQGQPEEKRILLIAAMRSACGTICVPRMAAIVPARGCAGPP